MSLTINGKKYEGFWASLIALPLLLVIYSWLALIFALIAAFLFAPIWIPIVLIIWLT